MNLLGDTYKTEAFELEEHDQQLTTCVARRCDLSETAGCDYQAVFAQITYRLLPRRDTSSSREACLSVACPEEGYAK